MLKSDGTENLLKRERRESRNLSGAHRMVVEVVGLPVRRNGVRL